MKEEHIKKIIKKSRIETSEVFVDELMNAIEKSQETKKIKSWWSFKVVLTVCAVLVLFLTFFLFKLLHHDSGFLTSLIGGHKMPIFIVVTLILLYNINSILKFNTNPPRYTQ